MEKLFQAFFRQCDINERRFKFTYHIRNNIIELQSLTHNQLFFPRSTLFKYSLYKSGYTDVKPDNFENPVEFGFIGVTNVRCEVEGCSWCK